MQKVTTKVNLLSISEGKRPVRKVDSLSFLRSTMH